MEDVVLIGIYARKHSLHLHGQDRRGKAVFRKALVRKKMIEFLATFHPCTVVMELVLGPIKRPGSWYGVEHDVKLINPQFVRPFVKSNKNDFIEAEAVCDTASVPTCTLSRQRPKPCRCWRTVPCPGVTGARPQFAWI